MAKKPNQNQKFDWEDDLDDFVPAGKAKKNKKVAKAKPQSAPAA